MQVGDLVWCVYHLYYLPTQGIVLDVIKDMDTFYVVLIEGEEHTLTVEEVFLKESQALQYQIELLRESLRASKKII